MSLFLMLAFYFFGSVSSWILELFIEDLFPVQPPEGKWINPGIFRVLSLVF